MSRLALDKLMEKFGDAVLDSHNFRGDETAVVARERIVEVMTWLRDDPELHFDMLTDLTAVDLLPAEPRWTRSTGCVSRCLCPRRIPPSTASTTCGAAPTGPSARSGTCTASASTATRTRAAS